MSRGLCAKKQVKAGHEAQILTPAELQPGADVLVCNFIPGINKRERLMQALWGLTFAARSEDQGRFAEAKVGWNHIPSFGLFPEYRGTIDSVPEHDGYHDRVWVNVTSVMERGYLFVNALDLARPDIAMGQMQPTNEQYATNFIGLGLQPIKRAGWVSSQDVGRWHETVVFDASRLLPKITTRSTL